VRCHDRSDARGREAATHHPASTVLESIHMLIAASHASTDNAALTAPASEPSPLQISSRALGDITVSTEWVMHFPLPLGGFPTQQEFVLIPAAREGLWWLQSMSDADLTFILADPFVLDSGYGLDLGDAERHMLHIGNETDTFALVMITLPNEESASATANCRAPVVFNLRQQVALQVVSRDDAHDVRRSIDLSIYKPQAIGLRLQR